MGAIDGAERKPAKRAMRGRPDGRWVPGSLILATAALAAWAFWWEPASLFNETHALAPPGWPKSCHGLRVAVLADLHTGSPFNGLEKLGEIVDATNAAQPDLVLLAGDYVIHGVIGGSFVDAGSIAAEFARLRSRYGIYAVLGNHDWWYDANRVAQALQDEGIELLEDRNAVVEAGNCRFALAGVSDFWEGDHDVAAALSGIDPQLTTVVFTHNPDVFPQIPKSVSLTIAGHTHGGQVNLPFVGRLVVPSIFGDRYAAGLVVEDGRHLFVSTGLGTSILPVRFRVPPEISVLVLE